MVHLLYKSNHNEQQTHTGQFHKFPTLFVCGHVQGTLTHQRGKSIDRLDNPTDNQPTR